jgi:hypothetical protein
MGGIYEVAAIMLFVPSFKKIGSAIQELIRGIYRHRGGVVISQD